ncbi:MAG TPA: hypothetical protein VHB20_04030, partial [Verrucomicrobiae bacterium]|nr:hypothetical protein [Verrucomicrobiae bacterium]
MKTSFNSQKDGSADEISRAAAAFVRHLIALMLLLLGAVTAAAAPVLILPSSPSADEDVPTTVSVGVTDAGAAIFTVKTTATSSNTNLISNASLTFNGSGTNRLLSIRPILHKSGAAVITVVASDANPAKTTNTFTLTVNATNYPPTFTKTIANQIRNENAASTNFVFSISDIETAASALTVTATSSNTTVVPNGNLVLTGTTTNRTLSVTQATNENGVTLISVVVTDGGGAKATNSFLLTVRAVNQPPTFTMTTNRLVFVENYGPVTNASFITGVSSGPASQASETNYFAFRYTTNFFAQAPAINTNGDLTFQTATNAFGTNTITIILFNSGSLTNGGKNSLTNVLTLDVPFVNQTPSFTLSTNVVAVTEETAAVTKAGFLTALSAGPANENNEHWTFAAVAVTNNSTNVAFATAPAIATNGTLTFLPAPHSFGTNFVTIIMADNGGTANGAVNSVTNGFEIDVAQTNHAPVIANATNHTVAENSTNNLTAALNVWSYDLEASNFVLTATSLSNALASVTITDTNVVSATNAVFTLTFAPATNAVGAVPIRVVATEGALSTTNTFTLTITPINQPPSYTLSTNFLLVAEETPAVTRTNFLTGISAGPANEHQTWTFATTTVTNNATNVAFATLPSVATNGTLTFFPAAHSFGTNTVTVVMTDSGGTSNGAVNAFTNSFEIGVVQTVHAPVIVGATNHSIFENATNNLTATVNVWSYDLQASNFVLTATSLSNALAGVTVTDTNVVSATNTVFTFTFAPGTNTVGAVPIRLVATEGALSTTNTFTLTITPINQPPSYTLSTNFLLVSEETPAVTRTNFLAGISAGPANEHQTWTFATTTVTNNATNVAFATLPSVATNGTLTFFPAAHSFGTNTVTVVMTDSGGTSNGAVNAFTNSFQIGVAQIDHAPVIVGATNHSIFENATNNLTATVNVWSYDLQASNFVLTATSLSNALADVTVTDTNVVSATNTIFTFTFAPVTNANGAVPIRLVATEGALSTTNTLTLNITPINQPPSYTLSTNLYLVSEETPAVTQIAFLTNISAGPANEHSQTWTFKTTTVTNNATNVIFATLPSVATNGTLTFFPAAHSFGTNTVTVVMTDSGGTSNGAVNAFTNSFQIGVIQTNHAPVIVGATNHSVFENATNGLTATVNVWSYDLQASNFVLTATSLSNALADVTVTDTNVVSATNTIFTITFAPVTNVNGSVPIRLVATEGALSTTNTLTLTITPVNQAPSFTLSTNLLVVAENSGVTTAPAFLTNISAGPANEHNQTWTFTVFSATNNATNATFAQFPTVSTNGALVFRPATNSFGTNTVTVLMTDSGSVSNSGVNAYSNSFQLAVAQVQYPPRFIGITNKTILENASTNLTLAFSLYDPLTTNFTVSADSSNTNLSVVSIGGAGTARTVIFAPVANANGSATITVTADDGSLTNSTNFTLTITPVNQAPSFDLAVTSVTADKYDVAVTIPSAITNISAGPTNESSQTVSFVVTNNNPAAFLVPPSINASGTLSFTPAATGASVTVGIKAVDTGGTANGGVNASAVQTLTITIPDNAFPYLTGPFAGLFYETNAAANASSGYFTLTLTTNGAFSGYLLCAGNSNTFSGQFSISNAHASVTASNYALDLTVDTTASWTESITGSVSNTVANWNSSLNSYLAGYSASFPTPLAGVYLMTIPGFDDPTAGPSGDSVFNLTIGAAGGTTLTGYTADDTYASQTSQLSVNSSYPLYVPLYQHG